VTGLYYDVCLCGMALDVPGATIAVTTSAVEERVRSSGVDGP